MKRLGVNIDHIATLRNARGEIHPNPVEAAKLAIRYGADSITFNLNNDLTGITSVTSDASNGDLTLVTNGTGDVVVNDTLTFSAAASDPAADTVTKIYNKTVGGGGTGLFFINSAVNSGTAGELISKSKATALAIALG